jgi:dTDP-4-amino-4,6-dideoxygalactose transaminase
VTAAPPTPRIRWWRTDLGEEEIAGVTAAIRARCVNQGPKCREFEERLAELLGLPHVTLTTSGSAALALSLLACGVKPGDEVVVPALTFIASAHAARLLGARVRLVDVAPDRPLMDPQRLPAALTAKTRAIMPVHINGMGCDMPAITAIARERGLRVVEDAAEAFSARCRHGVLGGLGDAGAFSTGMTKLMTTGEGGFVATRDPELHQRLLRLRNQGVRVIANNVFDDFGFNFRLTDLQAAIGLVQARRIAEKTAGVLRVHSFYARELAGLHYLRLVDHRLDEGELPLWTQVLCAERDKVVALLAARGIETRPVWPCLSRSPHLRCRGRFPNAEAFSRRLLTLPSGPDQSLSDLEETASALRSIASEIKSAL